MCLKIRGKTFTYQVVTPVSNPAGGAHSTTTPPQRWKALTGPPFNAYNSAEDVLAANANRGINTDITSQQTLCVFLYNSQQKSTKKSGSSRGKVLILSGVKGSKGSRDLRASGEAAKARKWVEKHLGITGGMSNGQDADSFMTQYEQGKQKN